MKIEKRGTSSYRIQSMYKGKRYSITFDHKPTQKEITIALAEKYQKNEVRKNGTVEQYALKRIENAQRLGRSPATISTYHAILRNTPSWFLAIPLYDLTNKDLQNFLDEYAESRSDKTLSLYIGFYLSIAREYRPETVFRVKYPERVKKMIYQPSTSDITRILDAIQGSKYSVFLQLSVLGVRRGEIAALTVDDLSLDNILTINKDAVIDENNVVVVKDVPKTSASNRRILIPAQLADEIRSQGYIYKGNIQYVNQYLHRLQRKLQIPQFTLHTIRHFAAAYLNKMGFTREQILEYGGWEKGSDVMEKVYSYNLDPEESQKNIATAFDSLIN